LGIVGISGSGKTRFTRALQESWGDDMSLLLQDNYYLDQDDLLPEQKANRNFDEPSSLDFQLLRKHLECLGKGKAIQMPNYNFSTHSRTKNYTEILPAKLVVVEGTMLFSDPDLQKLFDYKLFIDTPMDIAIIRRAVRDIQERGRDIEEVNERYLSHVRPGGLKYALPYRELCDEVISGEKDVLNGLKTLNIYLRKKIFQKK
jgi:uridine kinase